MKKLYLLVITAWAALRAGKVFAADNISVIASCREDADIIAGALKVLKAHTGNAEHYQLVTENIRMILVARNRHLPPFCVWHKKKQLVLRRDFFTDQIICPESVQRSLVKSTHPISRK